ncbi:MAG: hypothetical protein NTX22_07760 [Ignavibacteriales bacterium]|nr:hypothetical protein [Ignavibacteriales bacterium]
MLKIKFLFFLYLIILNNFIIAQTFSFCLGTNSYVLNTEGKQFGKSFTHSKFYPLTNPYLGIDLQMNETISSGFKFGYLYTKIHEEDFTGLELEVLLKYYPLGKMFLQGDINFHFNMPYKRELSSRTIRMIGVGAGYNLSKIITLEVLYYLPLKKEYLPKSYFWGGPNEIRNVIKFGILFYPPLRKSN